MDLSPIGSRIKAARENKKITQEELAALLDMSTTHISVIERGVVKLGRVKSGSSFFVFSASSTLFDMEKTWKCDIVILAEL